MTQSILSYFDKRIEIPLIYFETGFQLWGFSGTSKPSEIRGYHFNPYNTDTPNVTLVFPVLDVNIGSFNSSIHVTNMFANLQKSSFLSLQWLKTDQIVFNQLPDWEKFRDEVIQEYNWKTASFECAQSARNVYSIQGRDSEASCGNLLYVVYKTMSAELANLEIPLEIQIHNLLEQYDRDDALNKLGYLCIERFREDGTGRKTLKESEYKSVLDSHIGSLGFQKNDQNEKNQKLDTILSEYYRRITDKYP